MKGKDIYKVLRESYDIKDAEIEKVSISSINDVYVIYISGQKKFVLKKWKKNITNIISLKFQNELERRYKIAPKLYVNVHGNYVNEDGYFLQEYVNGNFVEKNMNIAQFLFKLHKYLSKIQKDIKIEPRGYKKSIECANRELTNYEDYFKRKGNNDLAVNAIDLIDLRRKIIRSTNCIGYFPKKFGIVHGDFKPDNLLYVPSSNYCVLDFDYLGFKDLDVEICRASFEFTNGEVKDVLEFIHSYCYLYDHKEALKNYLNYLLINNFPLNISNYVSNDDLLKKLILDRKYLICKVTKVIENC